MSLVAIPRPVTFDSESGEGSKILGEYAEFWKIPIGTSERTRRPHTLITTGQGPFARDSESVVIVSPSGKEGAARFASHHGLQTRSKMGYITLPVGPEAGVSARVEILGFAGPGIEPTLFSGETPIIYKLRGTEVYILAVDLVGEYVRRVYGGFDDSPSWRFKLATKLPFSYQFIPRFVRDRSFRSSDGLSEIREDTLAPVECLRTLFLACIVKTSGPMPRIRLWRRGKSYALAVTHDVETARGLNEGAPRLVKVEEDLKISSTWNVPSDRYPLTPSSLDMIKAGEIGGHDTKHDGRLIFLRKDQKTRRLKNCRARLELLAGRQVRGFRAPLLQHNSDLATAESDAGYQYDSSCPSWEILSPTSMRPHGVGTVFPFEMNGVLEIPVSLPQDHQLIRVAGQAAPEAVDTLLRLSKWIGKLGGACILLVHPDYEFGTAENQSEYHRLLEGFAVDPRCDILTLGELSDWWRYRASAHWDLNGDEPRIVSSNERGDLGELRPEIVTGYGANGFTTETIP